MFHNSESIPYKVGRFVLTIMHFALTIMLCISLVFTLSIGPARAPVPDFEQICLKSGKIFRGC